MAGEPQSVFELHGITKRFGAVVANDDVTIALKPGSVLGILGENGAGKSTLMNILSGLASPDSGEIRVDGRPVAIGSPRDAIALGVGMVHQHFMLVPTLSVAENVALGDHRHNGIGLRLEAAALEIARIGEDIGLPVDPAARVDTLDIGGQQRVEIIKALHRNARVLILDEPTAVLSRDQS